MALGFFRHKQKTPESCDSGVSVFGARDGIELLDAGQVFTGLLVGGLCFLLTNLLTFSFAALIPAFFAVF